MLSSFLFALITLIAGYCIVTKEFPPNFKKMWQTQQQLKNLIQLQTAGLFAQQKSTLESEPETENEKLAQQTNQIKKKSSSASQFNEIEHELENFGSQKSQKDQSSSQESALQLTSQQRMSDMEVEISRLKTEVQALRKEINLMKK